jgi:hypothetical protein
MGYQIYTVCVRDTLEEALRQVEAMVLGDRKRIKEIIASPEFDKYLRKELETKRRIETYDNIPYRVHDIDKELNFFIRWD